ncbi:MAG: hypothetical protein O9326_06430 [Microcystis sp. LE19-338.1B]|nr:hypothetical protein [Microcystis sp. LE19-338.1B]MCZ8358934.1 hypothetical protein [Microcystis sp. LE19-388.1G]
MATSKLLKLYTPHPTSPSPHFPITPLPHTPLPHTLHPTPCPHEQLFQQTLAR